MANFSSSYDEEQAIDAIMNNSTYSANFSENIGYTDNLPPLEAKIAYTVLFGVVILVGVLGNIAVLLLIALDKSMQTTVNKCLFVLAIADLLILVLLPVLPMSYEFLKDASHIGENMCYFLLTYERGAVVCSVLVFVFVSFDRYFAICYPLKIRRWWSGTGTYIILAIICVVAIGSSIPYAYMVQYEWELGNTTYYFCRLVVPRAIPWRLSYETAHLILTTFAPIPVLVYLYGTMIYKLRQNVPGEAAQEASNKSGRQGRSQVVKMLLTVVSIFVVCQFPFSFIVLLNHYSPQNTWANYNAGTYALIWIVRILIYINSAANPVVYFSMSSNFRSAFVRFFCRCRINSKGGWRDSSKTPTKNLPNSSKNTR